MTSLRPVLKRLYGDARLTLLSILTLAIGIGLTVAIFSLVYGVLLAPLPYPRAERLVHISHDAPLLDLKDMDLSVPLYLRYRERAHSFEELALMRDSRVSLTGLDRPDRVRQGTVSASLFHLAGIQPLQGRAFDDGDEKPGAPAVALISEGFWRGRLGSDPRVLERTIELDGERRQVVGVLPDRFDLPTENIEVWIPFLFDASSQRLGQFSYRCVGRLRDGVSLTSALSELKGITDRIAEEFPDESAAPILARSGFAPTMVPLLDKLVGDVKSALWVLLGAVGFILLMACVNVANVFLVRAEARRRELALRSALGASQGRILGEFFAEGALLAAAAGALGIVLAEVALSTLVRFSPEELPRISQIGIDGRAIAVALALSMASAILVALLPMLSHSRPDLVIALKEGGRGTSASRGRVSLRGLLVAGQMALGLVLLVGAGLMVRSFAELSRVTPGFRTEDTLTLRLSLPRASYDSSKLVASFVDQVTERVRALPGVLEVGASDGLPLTGSANGSGHEIEEFPRGEKDVPRVFLIHAADPGYREAMGIPLREGRWFEPADHQQPRHVTVVSEAVAKRYWPSSSALGKRISPGDPEDIGWYEIVGVVGDVHYEGLEIAPRESVYYPIAGPDRAGFGANLCLVVHAGVSPESLAASVRDAVWAIDANVPITNVISLERLVADSRASMAFSMTLLLLASLLAVLLGAIGTYGVVSVVVSQRTQEIGVRMALGALRSQVRGMVVRDGLRTVLPGLALGLVASFGFTRLMASLLFAVSPLDPLSFALAPVLLLLVALGASLLPAERASRVSPLEALRQE
jgi:putative ABC transport system permease protein